MRKKGKIRAGILLVGIVSIFGMTACQNGGTKLPNLDSMGKVIAVSREEGSGTRSEFETLLDTMESVAKVVATSSDEVKKQVSVDKNAIGYTVYDSNLDSDHTKVIKVDEKKLSAESIQKGKYPLCRNYYMAYRGELNAVGNDFLSYMMSQGQKIIGKSCVFKW